MDCFKKRPKKVDGKGPFYQKALESFPAALFKIRVAQKKRVEAEVASFVGPDDEEDGKKGKNHRELVFASAISSYPHLAGFPSRDGDPICDQYGVDIFPANIMVSIADGCGWGNKPRIAARSATLSFFDVIKGRYEEIETLKDCAQILIDAMETAHRSILTQKENLWEIGTTTLCGGVLLELDLNHHDLAFLSNHNTSSPVICDGNTRANDVPVILKLNSSSLDSGSIFGFIGISVGDSKVYHYCKKDQKVEDVTIASRPDSKDPTDCGGRIGPQLEGGSPDLRNLRLFFCPSQLEDLFLMVSDGVDDNLDPQHLGLDPISFLPHDFEPKSASWEELDEALVEKIKRQEKCSALLQFILPDESPSGITSRILSHCWQITKPSRDFMEQNPGIRLPVDYKKYPGKMDHTTCICFKVCRSYS